MIPLGSDFDLSRFYASVRNLMMTGYFNTISKSLDEAVEADGGSSWTILANPCPDLSARNIATAIYTFIQSWNEYLMH